MPHPGDQHSLVATVRIDGMTCRACERKVWTALSALPGVEAVRVSAAKGQATVTGRPLPGRATLDAAVRAAGYTPHAPAWLVRDRAAWVTVVAAAAAVALVMWGAGSLGLSDLTGQAGVGGVAVALLVGVAAGFSTCMALVGGLVMALTAAYGSRHPDRMATWPGRIRPQLAFNAGRVAGFAAGGAILGMLGSAFEIPTTVMAVGVLAAALVMTILGIRLTGLSPRIAAWSPTLPGRWGGGAGGGSAVAYSDWRAAAAGAATFVLPCGFTQAMQIYAVSTGSPAQAAAVMTAFALGTAPGLLGLGVAAGTASARGGVAALRWVGVVVLAFALVNAAGGLRSLGFGWPALGRATPTAVSENVTLGAGVQTVTMTQLADAYSPADTTVYAGIPIRWLIESKAPYTCAAFLRVPELAVEADLVLGTNTVDLPALDEGTTPFSCSMGMYSGSLTAIPPPA